MAQSKSPDITAAVSALGAGGIVAFPTETVYGLGADATNAAAVQKIFAAKGRPPTNPLIVHIADESIARRYAAQWPDLAEQLARAFWPGPLTLVLPKAESIVTDVTAGRQTVGLRVPNHPLALELLRAFDGPLAAPSANRSGHVSPTTAQHVVRELGDRIDMILDGGPCGVGIESTVLDISTPRPCILRPGGISRQQIESLIGPVTESTSDPLAGQSAPSPGMQAVHYSPRTPMFRFETDPSPLIQWLKTHPTHPAVLLTISQSHFTSAANLEVISMSSDPAEYAKNLYAALYAADDRGFEAIWIQMPPLKPAWAAVRDRLIRASILP